VTSDGNEQRDDHDLDLVKWLNIDEDIELPTQPLDVGLGPADLPDTPDGG
jgi:hypothetical protein